MSRHRLDSERSGVTHKVTINSTDIYITVSEYPGGKPGEIFIRVGKAGSELAIYDTLATMLSIMLQHNIPLEDIIKHLKGQRLEPQGITSNTAIPIAASVPDYLGKWLELRYLKGQGAAR